MHLSRAARNFHVGKGQPSSYSEAWLLEYARGGLAALHEILGVAAPPFVVQPVKGRHINRTVCLASCTSI